MSDMGIGRIALSIIITLFIYGTFPFLFAVLRKQPISKGRYRLIVIIATIFVWLDYSLISVGLGGKVSNGAPAVLWGFIFYRSGLYTLRSRHMLIEEEDQPDPSVKDGVPAQDNRADETPRQSQNHIESELDQDVSAKQWIYDTAANGMLVRIPAEKYENWRKVQDQKIAERETEAAQESKEDLQLDNNPGCEQLTETDDQRMVYGEAWNGMTVRIPLKNYETWKAAQDRLRAEHEADAKEQAKQELSLESVAPEALTDTVPTNDVPKAALVQNQEQKSKPRIRFCRKCGTELLDGSIYCYKCGTKVWLED